MIWTYENFKQAIYKLTTLDLSSYKERQMKRRIDSLISRNGYANYKDYFDALLKDHDLLNGFINHLTINVSEFYRNPNQWNVLEREILPSLLEKYRNLKIWSAACSTGEEPYSLAMLLSSMLPLEAIKILATDLDKDALQRAKRGVYLSKSLDNLPKIFINKYFNKIEQQQFEICDSIKKCVEFKHHDLLKDSFPVSCHLIVCRNVMIYFTEEAKSKLYHKFYNALHPDGYFFVGSTEQIILPQRYGFKTNRTFFYEMA